MLICLLWNDEDEALYSNYGSAKAQHYDNTAPSSVFSSSPGYSLVPGPLYSLAYPQPMFSLICPLQM